MKIKHLVFLVVCFSVFSNSEAQLLDKLSKLKKEIASSSTQEADLHLQASVQPLKTHLGGAVTFTIAVNNKGPESANTIISKVHIPNSYSITNISVTQGQYDQSTKLWDVGTLKPWSRAEMSILVVVLDDKDLMTTGEILSCSTQDPDSQPGNGIDTNDNGHIIDDRGDEDDGDGQNVVLENIKEVVNTGDQNNSSTDIEVVSLPNMKFDEDIKMVMAHNKDKMISYLDFDTMAMRMEDHSKGKKNDPIFWDKDGYIYSGEKGKYYKIPFDQVKNLGKNMINMFGGEALMRVNFPNTSLEFPNQPIIYNGYELRVYPNRYPILEWAFIYRSEIFEDAEGVVKEILPCRGNPTCTKFTATQGEGVGSTVLFDSKGRLAEITNPDGASAVYTYEPVTVKLPNAQTYNFNFKNN